MKVALVCDWLTNVGGAEKVLLEIHKLFPDAPIYASKYCPKRIDWFKGADVRTGWLQIFPAKMRRILGPLRQRYFSRLDLSEYDLIISVTGAEAKAVKSGRRLHEEGKANVKNPNGIHISYCHVPTQYYWQMYDQYVENPGFGVLNPVVRFCFKILVKPLKKADLRAAAVPDYYVTISEYAKDLIKKYYKREAVVIHPPVETEDFSKKVGTACSTGELQATSPSDYYITTSRQVNWKRLDLAVKACLKCKRKLLVIGEGPEHKKLVKLANGSDLVEFLPLMKKEELAKYLSLAKGYLFPSLEPFGIAPVEALAAGCPVIAFAEGGVKDYVRDGENGLLFEKQTIKSLVEAIVRFEEMKFDRKKISGGVKGFSADRFDKEIKEFVSEKTKQKN
ncbi:glycosyltransferase [Candidatus Saccharibacteria bacterium]|nr:glycosyltransferase [Candidatus Saccharibacteria bacterium]